MRKLATAVAVSMALASGGAQALGLGEIEMRSALNQPMDAAIPLTSVQPGEADGMIVKLAAPEAFARAGIERTNALTDLRFRVDFSSGTPLIRISSARPVVEPFLNFLLEVDWPQGRMVREYTVLLDPPVFMSANTSSPGSVRAAPTVTAAANTTVGSSVIEREAPMIDADAIEFDVTVMADAGAEVSDSALGGEVIALEEFDVAASDEFEVAVAEDALAEVPSTGLVTFAAPVPAGSTVSATPSVSLTDENQLPIAETFPLESEGAVVLSDLAAPNPAADDFEFEVAVIDGGEVGNDVVAMGGEVIAFEEFAGDVPAGGEAIAFEEFADPGEGEVISLEEFADAGADSGIVVGGGEVTVRSGDTLYEIAQANSIDGVSPQQMMLALLDANRNAFINGNINLVRAGAVLRVPQRNEALALSQAEAVAEVSAQHSLWQEYQDTVRARTTRLADVGESTAAPSVNTADAGSSASGADVADAQSAGSADALSADARAILENARQEVQSRNELSIVADNESASQVASATSDESSTSASGRLGEINRQLQLAREELTSSRRETADLNDQVTELESTTQNIDAVVELQNEGIARLEQQLRDARESGDAAASGALDAGADAMGDMSDAAGDMASGVTDMATDAVEGLAEGAGELAAGAGEALEGGLTATGEAVGDLTAGAEDLMAGAEDMAVGVKDAAGDVLSTVSGSGEVEPWYSRLLGGKLGWLLGGIGALLALLFGVLFFKPRRGDDPDESEYDDVEFLDDDDSEHSARASIADDDSLDEVFEDNKPGRGTDVAASQESADEKNEPVIDADGTINEAEMFLAYGLHDQAEELLRNAVAAQPDSAEYRVKLLQTYHAQGNGDKFSSVAAEFSDRFGTTHPSWSQISEMGYELAPGNALFGSAEGIESVGRGDFDAPKLDDNDFMSHGDGDEQSAVSQRRDFSQADDSEGSAGEDGDLLDQSLDPAFAFDEADLEATGDFSKIADEVAAETGESLDDFFGSDDSTSGLDTTGAALGAGAAGIVGAAAGTLGNVADAASDQAEGILDFDADTAFNSANVEGDVGSVADSGLQASANDLTLDLDQLSSEMELDSTELLDDSIGSNVSDLEIPDLTGDGAADLTLDGDADEMDTMLDLARAYIDMGDKDSASSALGEIVKSGTPEQVSEAETLLRKIS